MSSRISQFLVSLFILKISFVSHLNQCIFLRGVVWILNKTSVSKFLFLSAEVFESYRFKGVGGRLFIFFAVLFLVIYIDVLIMFMLVYVAIGWFSTVLFAIYWSPPGNGLFHGSGCTVYIANVFCSGLGSSLKTTFSLIISRIYTSPTPALMISTCTPSSLILLVSV
jgi:hypothetical protein